MRVYMGDIFIHKRSGEAFAAAEHGRRNGAFLNVIVTREEAAKEEEWKCQCCGAVHKEANG